MGHNGAPKKADASMTKACFEYISSTNSTTLKSLAAKYGLSQESVRNASYGQGWVELRRQYRQRMIKDAVDLSFKRDVSDFKIIVGNSLKMLELIQQLVDDPDGLKRYVGMETIKDGGQMTTKMQEYTFNRADMTQLKSAVESQRILMDGLYKLYAIPTQAEAESQRIASEKLELEREKFEAEQEAKSGDGEDIAVRLEVPEEYSE